VPEPDISNLPEPMDAFFDNRVDTYEDHMKENRTYEAEQMQLSYQFDETSDPVEILDLGAGTGMEIEYILRRAPNARFLCIDLSAAMLAKLCEKYTHLGDQIETVKASYFDYDFGEGRFDYVVAASTMHHWLYADKLDLYRRIHRALKPGGRFIDHDYIVAPEQEYALLDRYLRLRESGQLRDDTAYHIDIPFSMWTERRVLREAGFRRIETVFEYHSTQSNGSLIVAYKETDGE
jgi:tRNA (cmo5U34)-methyltransferase